MKSIFVNILKRPATVTGITVFTASFLVFFSWIPATFIGGTVGDEFYRSGILLSFLKTGLYFFGVWFALRKSNRNLLYFVNAVAVVLMLLEYVFIDNKNTVLVSSFLSSLFAFCLLAPSFLIATVIFIFLLGILFKKNCKKTKIYYLFSIILGSMMGYVLILLNIIPLVFLNLLFGGNGD